MFESLSEDRGALHGLHDNGARVRAREAKVHGRIDQSLRRQKDIRRAGGADGRRHVEKLLGIGVELMPKRSEYRCRLRALAGGHVRGCGPNRHAFADLRWRIRHGSNDGAVAEASRD